MYLYNFFLQARFGLPSEIPWHWLYYSGLAFAIGMVRHVHKRSAFRTIPATLESGLIPERGGALMEYHPVICH